MSIKNFSWVLPGKLAGSDIPGRNSNEIDNIRSDIQMLRSNGILHLVSLERPQGPFEKICSEAEITWTFFPIPDFGVPEDCFKFKALVSNIIERFKAGDPVCIHCHAGIGRTGMVLSCVVGQYFSIDAALAITSVKKVRAALDTIEQETFVKEFLKEYEH